MLKHLGTQLDHYFEGCGLPVDVFHFKSKHKEGDDFCAANCNPASWSDLITGERRWRFNSSVAEQTNVWFGKYLSIVKEMRVDRYNFFLDEMIRRRNEHLVRELQQKRQVPHLIPREVLLGST